MKISIRKPSLKKSIKARTTGGSTSMKKMKALIIVIFILCFICIFTKEIDAPVNQSDDKVQEDTQLVYFDNININMFIEKFNSISSQELTDIHKGNILTKCYCYLNNICLELLDGDDGKLHISYRFSVYSPNFRILEKGEIFNLLRGCLKTLDASEEDISRTISNLTNIPYLVSGYTVNDLISIDYGPGIEGRSVGYINIHYDYNKRVDT